MKTLEVVVGALFGSEAKGHITQKLTAYHAARKNVQVVRVAGPNAGHTGYDPSGNPWALRQVPVAAVVPGFIVLGIAPGSEIDLPVLLDEIDRLKAAGLLNQKQLWVSGSATMIYDTHKDGDASLVGQIGSTGKGIGSARADRIMRSATRLIDDEHSCNELSARGVHVVAPGDTPVQNYMRDADHLIIEGTQGYGLGLHTEFYPQVTSSNCRAIDFMAMAGVHPWEFSQSRVWAVARVFPIRVAGNSGPLKDEVTWELLGLPEEKTTVTKKVRRVGLSDWELVKRAVLANGGSPTVQLAITMMDQTFPDLRDQTNLECVDEYVAKYLRDVEDQTGAKIGMITTGPNSSILRPGAGW